MLSFLKNTVDRVQFHFSYAIRSIGIIFRLDFSHNTFEIFSSHNVVDTFLVLFKYTGES